ncbi:MAG: PilT/PilU family type 4a pilus ATPase [Candidatus Gastranaerophilales bacterium]|nr:PilT/PilU family type 4a pilus ATPase [Candidatus Gastranaerophilales bacterium]
MFDFENFLKQIAQMDVSDIHLRVNEIPVVRKNGEIIKTNIPPLSRTDIDMIVDIVFPPDKKGQLDGISDFDFLYEVPYVARFRVNYAKSKQEPMLVFRIVPYEIPTFKDKNLPNVLQSLCEQQSGLVLITGPTGCGKSTTLASMLGYINKNFAKHIITLEDPIEFLHKNDKSIFSQRQINSDTDDYPKALKYALRQDPDIILIGEIRDRETARNALSAAETGHLVFSTLHTTDTVQTINRIVNLFEPHEREQVREQLSDILRATISQKLLKTVSNNSRVPAFEILIVTPTIKDYIKKDNLEDIYTLIKEGKYSDMITFNMYLYSLVKNNQISKKTTHEASENDTELLQMFKGTYHHTKRNY